MSPKVGVFPHKLLGICSLAFFPIKEVEYIGTALFKNKAVCVMPFNKVNCVV